MKANGILTVCENMECAWNVRVPISGKDAVYLCGNPQKFGCTIGQEHIVTITPIGVEE